MSSSPLQFARDFEKLKSDLQGQPAGDLKLLLLIDFWPKLRLYSHDPGYHSYFDEYVPTLLHLVTEANLADLTISEVAQLRQVLSEVDDSDQKHEKLKLATLHLAKLHFYVGSLEEGLAFCENLLDPGAPPLAVGAEPSPPTPLPNRERGQRRGFSARDRQSSSPGGDSNAAGEDDRRAQEIPSPLPLGEGQGVRADTNEYLAFQALCDRTAEQNHPLSPILKEILAEWQGEKEAIYHDRAKCLFVERDSAGKSLRGRLRTLEGKVELFGKGVTNDEVSFDNQIKSPDDPFIGVAYDSLNAVRQVFKNLGMKNQSSAYYHAHFAIADSKQIFTGDSIGIAIGLLTYTQLLKPEIMRLDRFLSSEVAYTGGVESDGRLSAVNEETLPLKIKRAFFSPIKYLVVPGANFDSARRHLDQLKANYPRRHLALVPAERLSDAIDDHNVVRSEKICIGEFVARKAYKYTRMTKVQVPLLVVLGYLLLCLLYPKAWVGFDWRIDRLEIQDEHFRAINPGGHTLWQSGEFAMPLNPGPYAPGDNGLVRAFYADDVNNDQKDELFFLPLFSGDQASSHELQFYHSSDGLAWSQPIFKKTNYPGDSASMGYAQCLDYASLGMIPIQTKTRGSCVLTFSGVSMPYRLQLILFDAAGQVVSGPYLHTGQFSGENAKLLRDINNDGRQELILGGTNNRYERASLMVIDPTDLTGVSPPYDNDLYLASGLPKGSQLCYVAFPKTELSKGDEKKNWVTRVIASVSFPLTLEVGVSEGDGLYINGRKYSYNNPDDLPSVIYKLDSNFVPSRASFADHDFAQLNILLKLTGKKPYSDRDSLCKALMRDVVVYHGGSLVYHPTSGIDFHSR